MKTFLVLGAHAHAEILLNEDLAIGATDWTLHKDSAPGDRILFYITAPTSAIVAAGIVDSQPEYQANPNFDWYRRWLGTIDELKRTRTVPMRELRRLFPEWKQLVYLRQNARVPGEIVEPLLELLEITA